MAPKECVSGPLKLGVHLYSQGYTTSKTESEKLMKKLAEQLEKVTADPRRSTWGQVSEMTLALTGDCEVSQ